MSGRKSRTERGRVPRRSVGPRWSTRKLGDRRRRRIVRKLMGFRTYAEELQLELANPSAWFPWFLCASLFAKPISAATALRTASVLLRADVRTPRAVESTGWEGLVRLLDQGGYVRYDFSTADKLLEIARGLREPSLLGSLADEASYSKVEERLTRIRGVGPKTVEIFLRELQGRWKSSPPWSEEARGAASRLGLKPTGWGLPTSLRRRVENGLVRLWIEHCKQVRWQTCPVGRDCGCRP
jgi:hypothetical protein